MTHMDIIRKSKPPHKRFWLVILIVAGVQFLAMVSFILEKSYGWAIFFAYLSTTSVTLSMLFYQNKLNQELVQELDRLKHIIEHQRTISPGNVVQASSRDTQQGETKK